MRSYFVDSLVLFRCVWVISFFMMAQFAKADTVSTSSGISASEKPVLHIRHPDNQEEEVIYARRTEYLVALLKLALEKSNANYRLEPVVTTSITGSRNTRYLETGTFNLNWMHTNTEREQAVLPIRIPLFRGLIGWRTFFVRSDELERFAKLKNADELKLLTAGQGHDWPDTNILRSNGFKLIASANRPSLMQMLNGKRIDYFPRGLIEAWDELEVIHDDFVAIEESFILRYPTAYYFFVSKDNPELAQIIENGLRTAINDGSFNRLFFAYQGGYIEKANLENRKIIHLKNPYLPELTPLNDKTLWFSLEDLKQSVE